MVLVAVMATALVATSCGSSGDSAEVLSATESNDADSGGTADDDAAEEEAMEEEAMEEEAAEEAAAEEEAMEEEAEEPEEEPEEEQVVAAAPDGSVLRYAEFSPVTTFDPAAAQTAQSAYLYPVYDTLVRQNADFQIVPSLATSWSQPEPTQWVFELRDDVVFHDGAEFNAEVAAANLNRSKATEGNPNAATWAGFVEATRKARARGCGPRTSRKPA